MNGDHLPHPHHYVPHDIIDGSPEEGEHQEYYDGQAMEGEDQEYQEDEDGCATKKLAVSRIARKQAEDDVKLLANRIALLKMEEQKAWKKIEETKKKAKDIMHTKQRN